MAGSILTLVVAEPGLAELGRTIEARRLAIRKMIEQFYHSPEEKHNTNDRLKHLPCSRFRHKPPSLKASAGQIRRLVPFLAKLVAAWGPTTHSPEHLLVKKAMMHLFECYKSLSSSSGLPMSHLKSEASSYGQCLKELHEKFPDKYALKPKLHQFQELCSSGHRPALTGIIAMRLWRLFESHVSSGRGQKNCQGHQHHLPHKVLLEAASSKDHLFQEENF